MKTYTEEPAGCAQCGDGDKMDLRNVTVDNADREAWVCDACGFAHIKSRNPKGRQAAEGLSLLYQALGSDRKYNRLVEECLDRIKADLMTDGLVDDDLNPVGD